MTTVPAPTAGTRNGQKLFQITDLPAGLAVGAVLEALTADGAPAREVVWTPDGHRSVYADTWLDAHLPGSPAGPGNGPADGDGRGEDDKELWDAAGLAGRSPRPSGPRTPPIPPSPPARSKA
ncbi:hypothetical protein [Streptomyces sp. NPDC001717]|uniref:hypothetical protein n=1 Tax=Streptomyces sp. NPDC001717 TaxID=3364604 RepID=UPI0036914374